MGLIGLTDLLPDCLDQVRLLRLSFAFAIELHVVKPAIIPGFIEQLGMGADLFDVALVHHHDLVGGKNC